ncbi:MAG: type III-B CRISPR module-associated protein Cmr5 [bacterium]
MKNKQRVEALYEKADEVIRNSGIVDINTKRIHKIYESYICNFGSSVITIGLLPAVYSFYNKASTDEPCQRKIVDMIAGVLDFNDSENLLNKLEENTEKHELHTWKIKVIDASAALKMIIRTYTLQDKTQTNGK